MRFELTNGVNRRRFSRPVHSTTLPSFRGTRMVDFIEEFTFLSPDGSVRDSNMKISMNEECDDYTDDLFEDINGRNQFMD